MNKKKLFKLFFSMLKISAFTFGGGFVIVSMMRRRFVDDLEWLDEKEMMDMTAIAQSSPGAIAVNAAVLVGWHVSGFVGMVTAVIATILPPMVILSIISLFYAAFSENIYVAMVLTGMQAGVAAIILDVTYIMGKLVLSERKWLSLCILAPAFIAVFFFKINVIFVLLAAILTGVVLTLLKKGGEKA